MLSSEASTGYPDKFGIPNPEIKEVQELSLREVTLEVLKYRWSLLKVTHVVFIAAEDRTKTSLAQLQGGEGEPDLFSHFLIIV